MQNIFWIPGSGGTSRKRGVNREALIVQRDSKIRLVANSIKNIAKLLGVDFKPLNEKHGITKPKAVAFIDEYACIGCTLCILACPVDAIIGTTKKMHTIIEDECTGCELCLSPCPVDCIDMLPVEETIAQWHWPAPATVADLIATDRQRAQG